MAETLTAKLLRAHTPGDSQGMDDEVRLRVDQVLLEDYTGTMACLQFEQVGVDRIQVPFGMPTWNQNSRTKRGVTPSSSAVTGVGTFGDTEP